MERSKGILCAKIYRNSIVNETALNSGSSLMHYKGVLKWKDQREFCARKSIEIASLMKLRSTLEVP